MHLPVQLGHIRFEKSDQSIIAKIQTAVDTKVTLKTKDKWKTLIVKSTETCSIPTTEIKGCYSCDKGANAEIICTSNEADTIGNIECGEEVFAVQCNKTGQKSILNFHAEAAKFATKCTVDCGGNNKGGYKRAKNSDVMSKIVLSLTNNYEVVLVSRVQARSGFSEKNFLYFQKMFGIASVKKQNFPR
ncbi:unnamed protein product [Caenorhabditis nigoni]